MLSSIHWLCDVVSSFLWTKDSEVGHWTMKSIPCFALTHNMTSCSGDLESGRYTACRKMHHKIQVLALSFFCILTPMSVGNSLMWLAAQSRQYLLELHKRSHFNLADSLKNCVCYARTVKRPFPTHFFLLAVLCQLRDLRELTQRSPRWKRKSRSKSTGN